MSVVRSATGDFGTFTVTPGNKQVTIEWDEVLYAQSYTLLEAKFGEIRENVTSPYVWESLENGEVYEFLLTAEIPDDVGEDAVSTSIEKMPLSPRSFAPTLTDGYKSLTVEWDDNPKIGDCTVERRQLPDGPWQVRRRLTENSLTDTEVEHDTAYAYRLTPDGFDDVVSEATSGVPGRFPGAPTRAGGYDTADQVYGVAVSGSYAYVADAFNGLVVVDLLGDQRQ
jgi:hypothetical protein